jgi:tetratricopeptide (TPR) repeat protein
MNRRILFHVAAMALLLSMIMGTAGCSKYGDFKGEDYKVAWEKINKHIIDNMGKDIYYRDIKKDYILKAVIAELVRRGENPEKKCTVETASISEEKHIIGAWDELIKQTNYKKEFFEAFENDYDELAQLLQDNGKTKKDAYAEIGFYLGGLKKFDEAIEIYKKGGMTEVEANKELVKPMMIAGTGGYWFWEGKLDKLKEVLVITGKTEAEANYMVARAIAFGLIPHPGSETPGETMRLKKLAEETMPKYLKDEKKIWQLLGESSLNHNQYEWAAQYYEKIGNQEELQKAYLKIAWGFLEETGELEKAAEYFAKIEKSMDPEVLKRAYRKMGQKYFYDKKDLKKAAECFEKAGDKDTAKNLREKKDIF